MTAPRLRIFVLVTAGLLVTAIAQAQQPAPGAKSTTAAAQSPATTAAQPPAKAIGADAPPARTASAQKPADADAQFLKDARDAGFKPTQVRGSVMYCRTAVELGSNFPVRTCYNEEQTKVKLQEYQTQRNQMQQGRLLPPGMPAGCSRTTCQ